MLNLDKILFKDPDPNFIPKKINLKVPIKIEKLKDSVKNLTDSIVKPPSTDILKEDKLKFEDLNKQASFEPIRLTELPRHEEDFATKWFYGSQKEVIAEKIILEFNVYNQVLEELKQDIIKLPEELSGKDIAYDLETFILHDFTKKGVVLNTVNNLIHRAFYSHCVKRAIDSIRQGEFTTPDGYKQKRPDVADALERRINELLFKKLVYNKEEN